MSGSILRAENLHLWRSERHVLKGVALTVRSGELLHVSPSLELETEFVFEGVPPHRL